jgi:uncharacterized RDD family membrane protein YckC
MSHAGPPSDPPPPDPSQGGSEGESSGQQPYNPYPDNWNAPSTPGPEPSPYAQPDPYAQANPYGQQSPYAGPGQQPVGSTANPYGGPAAGKPTFGFGGYAGWFTRVGAYIVDYLCSLVASIPLIVGYVVLLSNTTTTTNPDGTTSADYSGSVAVPLVLIVLGGITTLAFFVWNVCIRQGRTGATIGKSVLAIRLVNSDLQPIGGGWAFLRSILHIVDSIPCYLGYLWPIWDSQKQTFADKIMNTYVIQATTPVPPPY